MVLMNRADIRRKSRTFTRLQMVDYLKSEYDIPASRFNAVMARCLPLESDLQSNIIRWLRDTYPTAFIWKAAAGPYSMGGIPDICAVIDGRFFGFEVKRPYIGVVSDLQKEAIKGIRQAGGTACVVSYPEDCEKVIREGAM